MVKEKKRRFCKDCGKDISNRGNRSVRCVECQEEYRILYKHNWRNAPNKGFFGITNQEREMLTSVGNEYDDYIFLRYKHRLDNCNDRKSIIAENKPLIDSAFKTGNEVMCLQYKSIRIPTEEEELEDYYIECEEE